MSEIPSEAIEHPIPTGEDAVTLQLFSGDLELTVERSLFASILLTEIDVGKLERTDNGEVVGELLVDVER